MREYKTFDVCDYLFTEDMIKEYLKAVEEENPEDLPSAMDKAEIARKRLRKRFVQIVITKLEDGRYHITWQDEHTVVRSMDMAHVAAAFEVFNTIVKLEVPDPKRPRPHCP